MSGRGVNKVILIGNLGADPDVRYMPSGDPVANLRIATSEAWKDRQSGEMRERTEWHSVVLFGRIADVAKQYLRKGSKIYVEGKLRTRKWQGQDGQDRYSTEVVVDINGSMQMLDGRTGSGSGYDNASSTPYDDAPEYSQGNNMGGASRPQRQSPAPQNTQTSSRTSSSGSSSPSSSSGDGFGGNDQFDDDIPF